MQVNRVSQKTEKFVGLAVQLKQQMNDIIDVAYRRVSSADRAQYKRFLIDCYDLDMRSRLGDCEWNSLEKTSNIRIVRMDSRTYISVLITTIHEVAHHIDYSQHGTSGHQAPFYTAYRLLLYAALNMGILTIQDMKESEYTGRSWGKVQKMLDEYRPEPVSYKPDSCSIRVYHAYQFKDALKARKYQWNGLDAAWTLETNTQRLQEEREFLAQLQVPQEQIKIIQGSAVVSRLTKIVTVHNVRFEDNATMKSLGYHWAKSKKCWEKRIQEGDLPNEEKEKLKSLSGVYFTIK